MSSCFFQVYRCADGKFVAVGALEDAFYAKLLEGLGLRDLPDRSDRGSWPELQARLAARFAERSRDAWAEVFSQAGPFRDACVTPVLGLGEAPAFSAHRARWCSQTSWLLWPKLGPTKSGCGSWPP